jgi:hypothetical protein
MTHPDYRALCAELLAALESWSPSGGGPLEGAEEQQETALIARARAALDQTQPPPDGEVAELVAVFREVASEDPDVVHIDPLWLTRAADLLDRLAQPEAEGPTDDDAVAACPFDSFHEPAEHHGWWSAIEWAEQRYARPTITPISVSERLPGAEDCDANGRCWAWNPESLWWDYWLPKFINMNADDPYTHWLPFHALPLPSPNCPRQP